MSYDLKNDIENLTSKNTDKVQIPDWHFFSPTYIIAISDKEIKISAKEGNAIEIWNTIDTLDYKQTFSNLNRISIKNRITKEAYLKQVKAIQQNIVDGNVYELNYCQEFYADNTSISPLEVFFALNDLARAPFSCYYKLKHKYLISSSPERFLKKIGNKLISQPIKGTCKRGSSPNEDNQLKEILLNSEKERAENVMIVDLVRNDLAKTSKPGTVKVNELFGLYPFQNVTHMISTISSELKEGIHPIDAIKNAFPMGSMTGAPKISAMKLIESFETTKRGLFSGSVGYINPEGDFDFNVVIRSILYNEANKYLSYQVGGAITYDSDPEKEYEECLIKAKTIRSLFQKNKNP